MIIPDLIIGSVEYVGLPDMGIAKIKARVDTGAKTSSLHASSITEFERDGQVWVGYNLHIGDSNKSASVYSEAPLVAKRSVRSSSGEKEVRHVIETRLCIADKIWPVEITLTCRKKMRFRMLLGRRAMLDKVLVNPSHAYLAGLPQFKSPENK